ncbi:MULTISPECIES: mycofactocin-coupled SDR family oxidoreductase [Rhodomicrobium]|uniref:mycofactocin-coupled SDR family oxidoreductase n=1 Tax=Rhodomicrobium TaxID=1068 RepID=UPI000B4BBCED|nr:MULTISPECIES: mycofactocin-coupled SDR family oxidoreductase [Rhodomicrobium]
MSDLEGKIALVTGAARGQGRSHAVRLVQMGAAVIAIDICAPIDGISYPMATPEDLEFTASLVREAGGTIVTAQLDIRDFQTFKDTVDRLVYKLGGLDIVVANAGVVTDGRLADFTPQQWDATISVNLTGTWNTMQIAVPHLIARGGGSIIGIASVAGLVGLPFLEPYSVSKHGIIGLVRSLALELADHKIRVNAICPTAVSGTGMMSSIRQELLESISERLRSAYNNALAIPAVEPADVSEAVLFLASDRSRFITGTTLAVDAGLVNL